MSQVVRYNFDTKEDFSKFKTYKWVTITGVTQSSGLTDKQIRDAFDTGLAGKGLSKVENDIADILIGYQFVVETDRKFELFREDWGYGEGWDTRGWHEEGSSKEDSSIIHTGELALDMYETTTRTLAWRGVASKVIDPNAKANERQKHLVNAVHKLMEHYPPVVIVRH